MADSTDSIEVRCTVFRAEDPDLFDYITEMPSSRQRKRAALLRLMLAGLGQVGEPPRGFAQQKPLAVTTEESSPYLDYIFGRNHG